MKLTRQQEWLVLAALFLILFAIESFVTHRYLTSQVPGANDFYSRWHGARALLVEGRNPYGLDVTAEIQPVIGIDPSEVGRGGFNYPLHVVFLFWPVVYLDYAWAQAVWLVTLQWVAIGMAIALITWQRLQPKPAAALAITLAVLAFYPLTRTIFLGQFTLHVTFFLVLALLALHRGYDGWAGILVAATSIKPQMVILIGPWLLLWAIGNKHWRFIYGLLGGGLAFLLASLALYPRWPLGFIEDVGRYQQVAGGRNPLALLLETLAPGYPAALRYAIVTLLVLAMLWTWWQGWRDNGRLAQRALFWTITVSLITTFQTGTTNQVLLVIPFFVWLLAVAREWGRGPAVILFLLLEVVPWAIFFATISGNYENPLLFLPLPFLTLLILIGQEISRRHTPVAAATSEAI
jgi:hypothetical protein